MYINLIVYYEFINIIENEINTAEQRKNIKRLKSLLKLKNVFSSLLTQLNIISLDLPITWDTTSGLLQKMNDYKMNIGDILILETILKHKVNLIVTTDDDWERTGIKSIVI